MNVPASQPNPVHPGTAPARTVELKALTQRVKKWTQVQALLLIG